MPSVKVISIAAIYFRFSILLCLAVSFLGLIPEQTLHLWFSLMTFFSFIFLFHSMRLMLRTFLDNFLISFYCIWSFYTNFFEFNIWLLFSSGYPYLDSMILSLKLFTDSGELFSSNIEFLNYFYRYSEFTSRMVPGEFMILPDYYLTPQIKFGWKYFGRI